MGKVDVVFWGDFSYFSEIPPRASWEVVMFEMIAEVKARREADQRWKIIGARVVRVGKGLFRRLMVRAIGAEIKQLERR